MYAVIRNFSGKGAKELCDVLEKHKADVESLMGSVKGLISYSFVRTADGGFSVTVCHDKAGTDDSIAKAKEWVAKNASSTGVSTPTITGGEVIVQIPGSR